MWLRHGTASAVLLSIVLVSPYLEARDKRDRFIIQCTDQCDAVIEAIRDLGGEVTEQYDNLDAVAASLPSGLRAELESMELVEAVDDDFFVAPPRAVEAVSLSDEEHGVTPQVVSGERLAELREAHPSNYVFSNVQTGAATLHSLGRRGDGVIVADIATPPPISDGRIRGIPQDDKEVFRRLIDVVVSSAHPKCLNRFAGSELERTAAR